jgi:hypothetical protein
MMKDWILTAFFAAAIAAAFLVEEFHASTFATVNYFLCVGRNKTF